MPEYDESLRKRLRQVGENLRAQRTAKHFSQEEVANLSGLHRTYVGAVERGERNITIGALFTLADTLEVSAAQLLPR